MKYKVLFVFSCIVCIFLIVPIQSFTNSAGAPANRVGAPTRAGDGSTCATSGCHDTFQLDSGSGMLSITVPERFEAGDTISITVTIAQSDAGRFGFQASVRGTADLVRSTGEMLTTNGTKFADAIGEYITHDGAIRSAGSAEWTFRWVAPQEDPQDIVVYAAAVAANDNNNRTGDRVYSTLASVPVRTSIESADLPDSFELYTAYPNPFTNNTTISYTLQHPEPVQFALYDALGRLVKSVNQGYQQAGTHEILVSGDELPAGTYYYRIHTPSSQKTHTLTRVR